MKATERFPRILTLVLAVIMCLAPLAAAGDAADAFPLYDALTTWNVVVPTFVNAALSGDYPTFKVMEELTNVHLNIDDSTAAIDLYDRQIPLMMMSHELPDMIVGDPNRMNRFIGEGLFTDLSPYLEEFGQDFVAAAERDPNIRRNLVNDYGQYYFFPQLHDTIDAALFMFNKPLCDELGIPVPGTTGEIYDFLVKAKEHNPDSVGWTKGQLYANLEHGAFLAYGTWYTWTMFKDGVYTYGPYGKANEMKEALTWLNKLYSEGLIDQEFETLDNDGYVAKFTAGRVAMVYGYPSPPIWNQDENGVIITPRVTNWEFVPAVQAPNGHKGSIPPPRIAGACLFVTNVMKDPAKAVAYMNYLYSPAGRELFNFGIEGLTYTKDADGNYAYTDMINKHEIGRINGARLNGIRLNNFPFYSMNESYALLAWEQTARAARQALETDMPQYPILLGTEDEEKELADIMVNVQNYVDEMIPKFIMGRGVNIETDFDKFLKDLEGLGIERAIEIKLALFEKWSAR